MNLEELIRDMAERGELTHLSISPVHNGKKVTWAVSFCAASPINGYTFILDDDPVDAMMRAITETKLKKRRGKNENGKPTVATGYAGPETSQI